MVGVSTSGGISRKALDKLSAAQIGAWVKGVRAGTATTAKLFDGGGLFLTVTPAGTTTWRMKYRYAGRERLHAIGMYPEITLARARQERNRIRELLRDGVDPAPHVVVHVRAIELSETRYRDSHGRYRKENCAWRYAKGARWSLLRPALIDSADLAPSDRDPSPGGIHTNYAVGADLGVLQEVNSAVHANHADATERYCGLSRSRSVGVSRRATN